MQVKSSLGLIVSNPKLQFTHNAKRNFNGILAINASQIVAPNDGNLASRSANPMTGLSLEESAAVAGCIAPMRMSGRQKAVDLDCSVADSRDRPLCGCPISLQSEAVRGLSHRALCRCPLHWLEEPWKNFFGAADRLWW